MNDYLIKVNNAFIETEAENEYDAINNLRIFGNPCLVAEYPEDNEWTYRVQLWCWSAFAQIKKLN